MKKITRSSTTPESYVDFVVGLGNYKMRYGLREADAVVFGDKDREVTPRVYGENSVVSFESDVDKDLREIEEIEGLVRSRKKIIAFGTSARLMCACSGGLIIQKVRGHLDSTDVENKVPLKHKITLTYNNKEVDWPSNHEQMMFPFTLKRKDYTMVGYARGLSKSKDTPVYSNGVYTLIPPDEINFFMGGVSLHSADKKILTHVEPEIVYFRNTNALCFESDMTLIEDEESRKELKKIIELFLHNKL